MAGNNRRDGFFDKPYATLATGAGVLIVVVCAIVFYTNGFGSVEGLPVSGTLPAGSDGPGIPVHAAASSGSPGVLSYNVVMTSGNELGEAAVPDKGVFIRVMYRGGYAGTWTSGNETGEVRNSGERIFAIENYGSTLSVDMLKLDNSSRQPLAVEIWKDGTRLATNSSSLSYGEVTVSGNL